MWEWLLSPIDASRMHDVGFAVSWHGRLMVLAWGVLAPLGVVVARYWKVTPRQHWPEQTDNQFWWVFHRIAQYSALVLTFIGVTLVWRSSGSTSATASAYLHHWMGWTITVLGVSQALSGWFRGSKGGPTDIEGLRGDHYDMTPRRIAFEVFHKTFGYGALLLAGATILTGLWQANAPIWMWLCIFIWWAGLIVAALSFQRRGMAVDTYQAIWGNDPEHPGNRNGATKSQ